MSDLSKKEWTPSTVYRQPILASLTITRLKSRIAELEAEKNNALRLVNNWIAWREMGCGGLGCLMDESLEALKPTNSEG